MSRKGKQGLPFLPGYHFSDVTKTSFHRPQTLDYRNGYAMPQCPSCGIEEDPVLTEQPNQRRITQISFEAADLAFSSVKDSQNENFIPTHVALDKKTLRFHAYFEERVQYYLEEEYRVRPVIIYYYLEDDSMLVYEPMVENSGILQGKRIKRQRLPKNERGEFYHWKDLNLGMDLEVYGVKYHITHCDAFTKEYMESRGIVLNAPEPVPVDPYSKQRESTLPSHTTPSEFDSMHQFLSMDGKVLRFFAVWDDCDPLFGATRRVSIHYYLVDDTVEITEVQEPNSGWDVAPVLMRRRKIPKKFKPECETFPSCVLELSSEEVQEFYSPKDFQVGDVIKLLGRRFLLYDCDGFTKNYYQTHHPDKNTNPIEVPTKTERPKEKKKEIPPYNGFGSLEDSLQNCLSLIPEPPKKNVIKMLENDHKVLRYSARLDSQNTADAGRRFIMSYYLANDTISIFEKPTRNSGIIGGKFLIKTRIPKPGSPVENPDFYSPADFSIGSTVEVFGHRFVLTNADYYVLKYLESISSQIPSETLVSLRKAMGQDKEQGQEENHPTDEMGDS